MPLYGDQPSAIGATTAGPTALAPGDSLPLFNNETVSAPPQASIVMAQARGPADTGGVTFFIEFATAPTDSLQILGSNKTPALAFNVNDWVSLYTSTNKQSDGYTDTERYEYYCAYLASQSGGGKVTVIAQR